MNHVNFSGMNFQEEQIMGLVKIFQEMRFLVGVHLSDNDITYQPFYTDILCDLGILDRNELNKPPVVKPKELPKEKTDYKMFLNENFIINTSK